MCVKYMGEVLRVYCVLWLYNGARVTIWRPCQDSTVDYKFVGQFLSFGKQITKLLSEEMRVSGDGHVEW